jgi:hypothetical protein
MRLAGAGGLYMRKHFGRDVCTPRYPEWTATDVTPAADITLSAAPEHHDLLFNTTAGETP